MKDETVNNPQLGEQFSDVLLVSDTNKKASSIHLEDAFYHSKFIN